MKGEFAMRNVILFCLAMMIMPGCLTQEAEIDDDAVSYDDVVDDVADDDIDDDDDASADDDTSDADDDTMQDVVEMLNVRAEDVPNPMGKIIAWNTNVPTQGRIEFCPDGRGCFECLGGEDEKTEHEVVLIGLRPNEVATVQAVATDGEEEVRSDEFEVTAGDLTVDVIGDLGQFIGFDFNYDVWQEELVQPGWVLTNVVYGDNTSPTIAFVLDEEGQPILFWHLTHVHLDQGGPHIEVTYTHDGNILVGGQVGAGRRPTIIDLAGRIVWQAPEFQPWSLSSEGYMHHNFHESTAGTLIRTARGPDPLRVDLVSELDREYNVISEWDTYASLPDLELLGGNTVFFDYVEDMIYYSNRSFGVFKVNRWTGEVLWQFNDLPEPDLPAFTPVDGDDGYFFPGTQHGVEVTPSGGLLLMDNRNDPSNRIVEYGIDESTMEASIKWQYPDADTWANACPNDPVCFYSDNWGDTDYLENGNVLVSTGRSSVITDGDIDPWARGNGKIMELVPDQLGSATKVWEVTLTGSSINSGSYAIDKMPAACTRIQ